MAIADEDGDRRPPLRAIPPGDRTDRGGLAVRTIRDVDTGVVQVLRRAGGLTGRAGIRLDLLRPGAGGAQEGEDEARENSDVRFHHGYLSFYCCRSFGCIGPLEARSRRRRTRDSFACASRGCSRQQAQQSGLVERVRVETNAPANSLTSARLSAGNAGTSFPDRFHRRRPHRLLKAAG